MAKARLDNVRLSYANLLVPRAIEAGQEPAYSAVCIIPKDSKDGKEAIRKLREAQEAAAQEGQEKFGQNFAKKYKDLVRDADTHPDVDLDKNPEYEGSYIVNVKNTRKPVVVDQLKNPLHSSDDVYSGIYANVVLNTFPYKHPTGGMGVSFSLSAVQKVKDGERFDGASVNIDEEFDELEVDDTDADDLLG